MEGRKPGEKRQLGKPRSRWEDNRRLDIRDIGAERVGQMHPAQDKDQWQAVVNTVMNLRVS